MKFFKARGTNSTTAEDLYLQAKDALKANLTGTAAACLAKAVCAAPEHPAYMRAFAATVQNLSLKATAPELKEAVRIALDSPHIDPQSLANIWYSLLLLEDETRGLMALAPVDDYAAFRDQLQQVAASQNMAAPLFLQGLRRLILPHMMLERFLTHLRRSLLDGSLTTHCPEEDITTLAAALAHYCFYTGYIFHITDDETAALSGLSADSPRALALLSCYEPLHTRADAKTLLEQFGDTPALTSMLQELVAEPLQEQEIAKDITVLTPIEDTVSRDVQQQYIDFPYPRWRFTEPDKTLSSHFEDIRGKELDILIAGCGTGQEATYYSEQFPNARILAVDLSPVSLSYAIRKTRQRGATNIAFQQADILALPGALDKNYDIISSSGVLHHMKDPEQGFAALDTLLKPGGLMRICLYSTIGRRHIIRAHEVIAENGYGNTAADMRAFRQDCPNLLPPETLDGIMRARDFFIMSQCRDLLFHVMEHQFDIPRIQALLDRHDYEFLEFNLPEPVLKQYREAFPDDPEAMLLDHWTAFEQQNPDTFAAMYKFVCRKKA